jgi:hypothetical protein
MSEVAIRRNSCTCMTNLDSPGVRCANWEKCQSDCILRNNVGWDFLRLLAKVSVASGAQNEEPKYSLSLELILGSHCAEKDLKIDSAASL